MCSGASSAFTVCADHRLQGTVAFALVLLAQTTTTEVRRIVGDPLNSWVVIGAGVALFVVILLASMVVRRRGSGANRSGANGSGAKRERD